MRTLCFTVLARALVGWRLARAKSRSLTPDPDVCLGLRSQPPRLPPGLAADSWRDAPAAGWDAGRYVVREELELSNLTFACMGKQNRLTNCWRSAAGYYWCGVVHAYWLAPSIFIHVFFVC